jgi:hypothetical protein
MGGEGAKQLSSFVTRRDISTTLRVISLSGFKKLWHHIGGRMQEAGAGLGFCNVSLSWCVPQAWPGAGRGGRPPSWSIAQLGGGVLKGTFLGQDERRVLGYSGEEGGGKHPL